MEFAVAIVAGLTGALVTYLAQNYFAMQSEDSAHLNDHISEMKSIEEFAVSYWLTDPVLDPTKDKLFAAKIQGAIFASSCFNGDARRILGNMYSEYVELDQSIYDAVTGGGFQTANRKIEYERVVEIMALCNQMRSLLRRSRRRQFWAH